MHAPSKPSRRSPPRRPVMKAPAKSTAVRKPRRTATYVVDAKITIGNGHGFWPFVPESPSPASTWRDRAGPERAKPSTEEVEQLVADVVEAAAIERPKHPELVGDDYVLRVVLRLVRGGVRINYALEGCAYYLTAHETILIRDPEKIDDVQWVLAHELGHHVIRTMRGWNLSPLDEELTANAFATKLTRRVHPELRSPQTPEERARQAAS